MEFLELNKVSLKICGVRLESDAEKLAGMGVDAIGFNFWQSSKRYLNPDEGGWMKNLAGRILRVGVFVNEHGDLPFRLYGNGLIDAVQLHGDEDAATVRRFPDAGIPVIKAMGIKSTEDIETAGSFPADAILLDAHAPQVFGGTGETFDWKLALDFKRHFPKMPMILAGGITPRNAASAVESVGPAALDIASGAEVSPGVKDFEKVAALLSACRMNR